MFHDDSFPTSGTAPPAELFPESSSPAATDENNLDDVWGSDDASSLRETSAGGIGYYLRNEPSEIPRLRSEHSTSGYRDGVAAAKGTTIQEGFDEGYGLGAVIGLEVGAILGMLEGIFNAVKKRGSEQDVDSNRMKILLEKARAELKTEEVFAREWWGSDGIWKYPVANEGRDEVEEFTFKEVVQAHPLIRNWRGLVLREVEKWNLDFSTMERDGESG